MALPKPYIKVLSASQGGGFGVGFSEGPSLYAEGKTLNEALENLSAKITLQQHMELGDSTPDAEIAARQADLLNNDSIIRHQQMQQSILLSLGR